MADETRRIPIIVREKVAKLGNPDETPLVCGNNDYVVEFDFDEAWANYPVKTALFVFGSDSVPVVFNGNVCKGVAVKNSTACAIGVFAGDIRTTTGAFMPCVLSITDIGKTPKAPTEDVYNQIMELLQKAIQAHTELPVGGKKGQVLKKQSDEDYDTAWEDDAQGSAKLYKHRVCLNSIYNEETWMDDPSFIFYVNFYRSTPDPVTSFDEIQGHELMLEKMKWFTLWDGPDANRTAIALSKSKNGWLVVEYISAMYEYETVVFDTTDVSFAPDQFTITDTVYEV